MLRYDIHLDLIFYFVINIILFLILFSLPLHFILLLTDLLLVVSDVLLSLELDVWKFEVRVAVDGVFLVFLGLGIVRGVLVRLFGLVSLLCHLHFTFSFTIYL